MEHSDLATFRCLLRARRERPRGRSAAKDRDELAPLHSITSYIEEGPAIFDRTTRCRELGPAECAGWRTCLRPSIHRFRETVIGARANTKKAGWLGSTGGLFLDLSLPV
jgi:hypothetical protein